jgi:LAO/AO transport system kinase
MRRRGNVTSSEGLIEQALAGNLRALSRLASRLENDPDSAEIIVSKLFPLTGRAHVIGVTGAPGVGKSSLLAGLAQEISRRERSIAIIAVDPSSPRTGGATLGDRIRMSESALDPRVFVRSLASRGHRDGLAPAAADSALLFDAAGYDYVAIETVGAGQNQLDIAELVHTTVLVQIPGAGDSVQLLKAGAMEIADIYVVNKSDLPGAQRVSRDLRSNLLLATPDDGSWDSPIVLTSSSEGSGFEKLLDAIDGHYAYLKNRALLPERNERMAKSELKRAIDRHTQLDHPRTALLVDTLVGEIAGRQVTPDEAAKRLLIGLAQELEQR